MGGDIIRYSWGFIVCILCVICAKQIYLTLIVSKGDGDKISV